MTKGHDKGHKVQMSDREVMKLALEALIDHVYMSQKKRAGAITALRQALEQPEREWVGLTDEELEKIDCVQLKYIGTGEYSIEGVDEFARAIEDKLKEKNRVDL